MNTRNLFFRAPEDTPATGGDDTAIEQVSTEQTAETLPGSETQETQTEDLSHLSEAERELFTEDDKKQEEKQQTVAQPSTIRLDPESLAALQRQQTPATAPKLSDTEVAELLKTYTLTADDIKSLGFAEVSPEQVKAFNSIFKKFQEHPIAVAKLLLEQRSKQFEERLTPLQTYYAQREQAEAQQQFFSAYPSLSKYGNIVKLAASNVNPAHGDGRPKTVQEIYREVAKLSVLELRKLGINPAANPSAAGGDASAPATRVPASNRHSSVGRSGGGNAQQKQSASSDGAIYSR